MIHKGSNEKQKWYIYDNYDSCHSKHLTDNTKKLTHTTETEVGDHKYIKQGKVKPEL